MVNNWENEGHSILNEELDRDIDMEEILYAINNLENDKAAGYDKIVNEFISNGSNLMKTVLLKIFNSVFHSGVFPEAWAIGEIIPIHRKVIVVYQRTIEVSH